MSETERYLQQAIELARQNMQNGGRPFGAVIVREGEVLATGVNEILSRRDPTAHAEMMAIRTASQTLGSADLGGCTVYASGHPCPMCMAAMRMSGIGAVFYAYSNEDGAAHGLSTAAIYADLAKPFAEQSMQIRYLPVRPDSVTDLYVEWSRRQHASR